MQKIFFIGIKGAGMSALAQILHAQGYDVGGSDIESYVFTEDGLKEVGITNIFPFQETNVHQAYDLIIRGNAFNKDNNIEVAYLAEHNIPTISYYEFLQQFITNYTSIAVSGTHGKTTTTGLLATLFADDKFAYLIGDGTGHSEKDAEYFIFEACEYKRHFLSYYPDYLIITNVEFDHPDYFKDLADVTNAFSDMAKQTKKSVIAYGDDEAIKEIIAAQEREKFLTFGFDEDNDFIIKNYQPTQNGMDFELWEQDVQAYQFHLPFFGKHMLFNALAAMLIGHIEGKSWLEIETQISKYTGVKRRFNIELYQGYTIVDDYAHHPTEIAVTLEASRQKFPDKKQIVVFQAHTFTRTEALATEFIDVLKQADIVYLTDIFASARESGKNTKPDMLLNNIPQAEFLTLANIEVLKQHQNDALIFMGAGDIGIYLNAFKKKVEN